MAKSPFHSLSCAVLAAMLVRLTVNRPRHKIIFVKSYSSVSELGAWFDTANEERITMRNCLRVVCLLFLCVTLSAAQEKISSQWKCDKPSEQHSIAVPDSEGHNYGIAQGKCTSEKGSMGDAKEQEGTYSEFGDVASSTNHNHGVFV